MTDLLVVGGGPAGVAAALEARRRGASVTLLERAALGGTCVHAGCIPSAAFHRTAEALDELRAAQAAGVRVSSDGVDWARMQGWVGAAVNRAAGLARASLENAGVEVLVGAAHFDGPDRVIVRERVFERVPLVVATGAVSFVPPLPSAPSAAVLTNTEAMALDRAPARLVIAGAGRFSLEWADFFVHLGSSVVVADLAERILPDEDSDMAGFVQLLLEQRGVRFELGTALETVVGMESDAFLFADTRAPSTAGLRLEMTGLTFGESEAIEVDERCQTSVRGLFAAGDVTGPPWLSNRARAMGAVAAINALGGSAKFRAERLPRSVNTHPELAAVGLTEAQAQARGLQVAVGYGELATSLRGMTLGKDQGALKLVVDSEFGEILGAHMVGVGALEVIAQVAAAMELEADYRDLARVHHIHPSLAELVTDAIASAS